MTREELFSVFPRPWRPSPACGAVLDNNGVQILVVDVDNDRADDDVRALVEVLVELANEAKP